MENKPTPEQIAAMMKYLEDTDQILTGSGEHAEHTQEQIGRCVYCSCGTRVQGRLIKRRVV